MEESFYVCSLCPLHLLVNIQSLRSSYLCGEIPLGKRVLGSPFVSARPHFSAQII
jgi:hypothetical protein